MTRFHLISVHLINLFSYNIRLFQNFISCDWKVSAVNVQIFKSLTYTFSENKQCDEQKDKQISETNMVSPDERIPQIAL